MQMGHVCAKDPGPAGRCRATQDGQSQEQSEGTWGLENHISGKLENSQG